MQRRPRPVRSVPHPGDDLLPGMVVGLAAQKGRDHDGVGAGQSVEVDSGSRSERPHGDSLPDEHEAFVYSSFGRMGRAAPTGVDARRALA